MDSRQTDFLNTASSVPLRDLKAFLEEHTVKILREVSPPRATLRLLDCNLVSKDFFDSSSLYRLTLGRWLLKREFKVYERLKDIPGVMQGIYLPHKDLFCMEYLDNYSDLKAVAANDLPPEALEQLERIIAAIHERNIVHFDIGHDSNGDYGRETNILWSAEEQKLCLIDFAGSIDISLIPGFISKTMRVSDWLAAVKLCAKFFPGKDPQLPLEISDFDRKVLKLLRKI